MVPGTEYIWKKLAIEFLDEDEDFTEIWTEDRTFLDVVDCIFSGERTSWNIHGTRSEDSTFDKHDFKTFYICDPFSFTQLLGSLLQIKPTPDDLMNKQLNFSHRLHGTTAANHAVFHANQVRIADHFIHRLAINHNP
jgi:hypothetical protein